MSKQEIKISQWEISWECGDPSADVIVRVYADSQAQAVAKALHLLRDALERVNFHWIIDHDNDKDYEEKD